MPILEFFARTVLFVLIFFIGLDLLFIPENYDTEWKVALKVLSINWDVTIVIQSFGGLVVMFSLLSFLFSQYHFDLLLLLLLVISSAAVYNPINLLIDQKSAINLALISSLLLERTTAKTDKIPK